MKIQQSCRVEVLYGIRDARGLDAYEKSFLFVVETRGVMFTSQEQAMADMGMKRSRFYKTRDSLRAKGLLEVTERGCSSTIYRVNAEAVRVATACCDATPSSPRDNTDPVATQHTGVRVATPEEDLEEAPKENKEEARALRFGPSGPPLRTQPAVSREQFTDLIHRMNVADFHTEYDGRRVTADTYFVLASNGMLTEFYELVSAELANQPSAPVASEAQRSEHQDQSVAELSV